MSPYYHAVLDIFQKLTTYKKHSLFIRKFSYLKEYFALGMRENAYLVAFSVLIGFLIFSLAQRLHFEASVLQNLLFV